ncbi:MAG: radical SAM protein [Candidatus Omnitrophica bacterium]|nr:radical SAM protein [Candidatus Omnitrophota bacterium]
MDLTPRIIFWETTRACNLHCHYCRMQKNAPVMELTTGEAKKTIEGIAEAFGAPILVLSGGEPLLRKDIYELIAFAKRIGLPTAVATNGVLLDENVAMRLKESGVSRVSISLDSVNERSHDLARGLAGAFKRSQVAAGILKEKGIPFQINFTITKENQHELRPVAKLAISLGAEAVHYFVLVPVGCGKEIPASSMLDADGIEGVLAVIKALSREFTIEIRPTCAPQYVRLTNDQRYRGCLAGTSTMFISAEGDIYPCGYFPVQAGSLRVLPIKDIWRDSSLFQTLRKNDLKGGCAVCDWKNACRGCRARAYGMTGDYLAGDTTCAHARAVTV